MLTSKEIRSTTFMSVKKGYATEDVDAFLNKIAGELDTLQNECAAMLKEKDDVIESLRAEKKEVEDKMMVLAEKVEEYRSQENILHNAFINAEKMKESVLAEARQTSEILLMDAQTKADRILDSATGRVDTERANYEALQQEVAKFKNTILDVYKSHLGIIASLPDYVSEDALNEALADAKQDAPETGEPEDAESPLEDLMEEVPFDSAPEVTEELETEEPAAEAEEPEQQEEPAEEAEDSVFGEAFTF